MSTPSLEPPLSGAHPLSVLRPARAECVWLRHVELKGGPETITLEAWGTILGTVAAGAQNSPEIQAFSGMGDLATALIVFCCMMNAQPSEVVRLVRDETKLKFTPKADGLAQTRLLEAVKLESNEVAITDLWFANQHDLVARIERNGRPSTRYNVVRFFQFDLREDRLLLLNEASLQSESMTLVDVETINPFLPIIVCFSADDGELGTISLLAFPSLCRGGIHHAELLASAGVTESQTLRLLSCQLLTEWFAQAPGSAFGHIEVDVQIARGTERIFSKSLQNWLARLFQLTVTPAKPGEAQGRVAERREGNPGPAYRKATAKWALRLPADAVPSLKAIVSRAPGNDRAPQTLGPLLIADNATGMPKWLIETAISVQDLLNFQPIQAVSWPTVLDKNDIAEAEGRHSTVDLPLAIRFLPSPPHDPRQILAPLNNCKSNLPQCSKIAERGRNISVSVLYRFCGILKHFAAFLDSLKLQEFEDEFEVIVALPHIYEKDRQSVANVLQSFFPTGGRIQTFAPKTNPSTWQEVAAANANGLFLLFIGGPVLLHESHTLETLRVIAARERAATAGCMLISSTRVKNSAKVEILSAGLCWQYDDQTARKILVRMPADAVIHRAIFPVAAPDPLLFMTRAVIWRQFAGPANHGIDAAGFGFAVRSATEGYLHVCTSELSASLLKGNSFQIDGPVSNDPAIFSADFLRSGITLRKLV